MSQRVSCAATGSLAWVWCAGALPRLAVLLLATALAPERVVAQTGLTFEFSFSNPGARSLGLGGAFAGLADDATAAFANPAGLVQLVRPEVSIEVRHWPYSTPFTRNGRVTGEPTGIGIDTEPGIVTGRSEDDVAGLSFFSLVYPKERWSIAFYRHLLANFESRFETQGIFGQGGGPLDTARLLDRRDRTDLEIVTYALSGAYRVTGSFSLGLGLTYFEGSLQAGQDLYGVDDESLAGYFGETSFLPERRIAESSLTIDDSDFGFAVGLLWRLAGRWHLGGFFRQGPEFDLISRLAGGPASEIPGLPPGSIFQFSNPVAFPGVYGLGIAYRSGDGRLTLSFEWDRVEYSAIFDSLGNTASAELLEDGNEYHLGGEFAFLQTRPVFAVRLGVWRDPDHGVKSPVQDPLVRALFGKTTDEIHYSVGLGAAFRRFQIDFGADFSDRRDTISLSGIYSF